MTFSSLRPPSSPLLAPNQDSRPSSPRPSSPRASSSRPNSPRASPRANGTPHFRKHLRIEERSYFTVPATQSMLPLIIDYLKVIVNLSLLTTDTMSRVIEFLKAFNSRTCQVVLGAGAMRSAGLKNITAKHLALASQSLSIVIALIPYVRETFRRHLSPKQAVMLIEFDKLKRDYQEHQNEIHAKLIAIMGDRLSAHIKSLNAIRWDAPPAKPGTNEYMELLVKETVTLHKVLSRYLASPVVEVCRCSNSSPLMTEDVVGSQYVMTQVFAAINHRLSEEYSKIELPTLDAKERCARWPALYTTLFAHETPLFITVYLQTHATCTRNSQYSKPPARQLPSSKHSSPTSASPPRRPSPHGQRHQRHLRHCRYPPTTSLSARQRQRGPALR